MRVELHARLVSSSLAMSLHRALDELTYHTRKRNTEAANIFGKPDTSVRPGKALIAFTSSGPSGFKNTSTRDSLAASNCFVCHHRHALNLFNDGFRDARRNYELD